MAISLRARFDVFKRDRFTCQYCGGRAPAVRLQIEHVHPKAHGGEDHISNLVTACFECNSGKGARPLSADEVVGINGELQSLIERLAEYAVVYQDVAERMVSISNGRLSTADWIYELWALLGELQADTQFGDRIRIGARR